MTKEVLLRISGLHYETAGVPEDLICISLMIKDFEHVFKCFTAIQDCSAENSLISLELHF